MNKLRAEIVLFIDLFLVLLLGGILLFYSLFADNYYISRKKHQINEAYAFIETLDLSDLGSEDEETFLPLAESSYTVIICDAAFQTLYSSNAKSNGSMLQDQIRKKADSYTEKAEAGYFPELTGQPISSVMPDRFWGISSFLRFSQERPLPCCFRSGSPGPWPKSVSSSSA